MKNKTLKTYTIGIKKPLLEVRHDTSPESPREWDNLGYFITVERRYSSPDGHKFPHIQQIVETTGDDADNQADHIERITAALHEDGEKVLAIYPVYRYEHGNVLYKRGTASGFDYSNCGFYIVTDKTANVLGTPADRFDAVIDGELETYTAYANGEVYYFMLHDENGDIVDSCGGFYDVDHIREYLPDEWQNEDLTNYIVY